MKNLFISFLGTNCYVHARYQIDEFISKPVRYVQEAMVEYLCRDWSAEDKIVVFATDGESGSYRLNWLDAKLCEDDLYAKEIEPKPKGLKERLENLGIKPSIEVRIVPDGLEEKEIWKIIEALYDEVQEKDRLYIDTTHSFRFIPMIVPAMITFLKTTKNIELHSIHYGAFEALGYIKETKKMPLEQRIAPVRELTEIYRMIEWSEAANAFLEYGDAKRLDRQVQKIEELSSTTIAKLDTLKKDIFTIDEALKYNNVSELRKLSESCLNIDTKTYPQLFALQKLSPKIEEYLSIWSDDEVCNALHAAQWCIKKDRYAQALTFAQEGLITYFCECFGWDVDDWWYRGKVHLLIKISLGKRDKRVLQKYKRDKSAYESLKKALDILSNIDIATKENFRQLSIWRNTVSHANEGSREELRNNLPRLIDYFMKLCKEMK